MSESEFTAKMDVLIPWLLGRWPVLATETGIHTHDHLLADYSKAALWETRQGLTTALAELSALDPAEFGTEAAVDYQLAAALIKSQLIDLDTLSWHTRNPGVYLSELYNGIFSLILRNFAPWPTRFAAILSRLGQSERLFAAARDNLSAEAVPPLWVEIALEQAQMAPVLFTRILGETAASQQEKEEIARAGAAAETQVRQFATWLREDLLPRAEGRFAAEKEVFDLMLRQNHMVDYNSDELLETGRMLFHETKEQMTRLARQIDPQKSASELMEEAKKDHPTAASLLDEVRVVMVSVREFTEKQGLAGIPPGERLDVIETPVYMRPLIPIAAYIPPAPFEDDLTGYFMVTPPDPSDPPEVAEVKLRGHNYAKLPVTALHEAYPGHHLQLSRAATTGSAVRKLGMYLSTLFIEGWAFYCEELMEEAGFIQKPIEKLSRLHDQLWRAARIILDVGIHCRGMSVDEAITFFVEHCGLEAAQARAEVHRYTLSPTQPQSYLMGKLEIQKIVATYQANYPDHSLRQMHDAILDCGSLPPKLLHQSLFP